MRLFRRLDRLRVRFSSKVLSDEVKSKIMDWLWLVWLIVVLILFTAFEGYALLHPERMHTLSYWVWFIATRYPLACALPSASVIVGLSLHFWNYVP